MTMDNGKMERKEIDDTTSMVAWFTTEIPVPAGPEVQGQLARPHPCPGNE
jgi:Protein of unknown function (Porph_ging).